MLHFAPVTPAVFFIADSGVRAVLTETSCLVQILTAADRTDRATLYRALGLRLQYEK